MTTQTDADRRHQDESDEPPSVGVVVASLSSQLNAERIGMGALAELRRITKNDLPPAFWNLYLKHVPIERREPGGRAHAGTDRAWAALIRAMVEMAPTPHTFEGSFGEALANAKYSELRFIRVLRSKDDDLARELRTAGLWLARAGIKTANWEEPAHLLLGSQPLCGSDVRRPAATRHRMARDYFRTASGKSD